MNRWAIISRPLRGLRTDVTFLTKLFHVNSQPAGHLQHLA